MHATFSLLIPKTCTFELSNRYYSEVKLTHLSLEDNTKHINQANSNKDIYSTM